MELFFKQYGEGPPLVILHGLLGASGNWHTLASKVFGAHFTVYAVDQRNHGRSPHDDRFDYEAMADDLRLFLDRHALEAVHLIGHSMGGKTAMHFARAYPGRVRRLVVVDIAPKAYPPHHLDLIDALRGVDLSTATSRQDVDAALARRIPSVPVRQFLLKNLSYDSDAGRYFWQVNLDVIARHYDRINEAPAPERPFEGPTLFIRGAKSSYVAEDDLPLIHEYFPHADLVTVDAGHWVHAEAPEAFADAVLAFLNGE